MSLYNCIRQKLPVLALNLCEKRVAITYNPLLEQSRLASKKSGGSTRNRKGRAKPKYRHYRVQDGEFVHEGDVIATQYGLRWYPGENVLADEKLTLTAAYDGILIHTKEQLNPYPDSPLFNPVQSGLEIKKRFFHVIPTQLHGKFRLISQT